MIIVIEGIDGSGKTTQTKILMSNLKKFGFKTETLSFPQYKQFFGRSVKQFLKGDFGDIKQVDPRLAGILYALDRWQTKEKLRKWIKDKKIIILNRYTTSNLIHQTIKLPAPKRDQYIKWVEKMEYGILNLPKPDMVIYLYLPYKLSYALINKRGKEKDIHESNLRHLKQAAQHGLKLAEKKKNWYIVQCNNGNKILSKQEISQKILTIVKKKIKKHTI